ncbi:hypothetical protein N7540_006649 [Penicillium herquei]|nr:hypothetical protein N7540_006649 [Penicillium herquei]
MEEFGPWDINGGEGNTNTHLTVDNPSSFIPPLTSPTISHHIRSLGKSIFIRSEGHIKPVNPPFEALENLHSHQPPPPVSNGDMTELPEAIRQARYRFRPGSSCQHNHVLRYFSNPDRPLICDECHQQKRLLYACTADTADFSPVQYGDEMPPRGVEILPAAIQKAIAEGHYNSEQVNKLITAKMDVLASIMIDYEHVVPEQYLIPQIASMRQSTMDWLKYMTEQHEDPIDGCDVDPLIPMPCQFRVCANCRPALAQRAFDSLNAVVNEPYQPLPAIPEYLNRPIVLASVAANLPEPELQEWANTPGFRPWWKTIKDSVCYDVKIVVKQAKSMGLAAGQFKKLIEWLIRRCKRQADAEATLKWLAEIQKTPSQIAHFLRTLTESRTSPRLRRSLLRSASGRFDPETSISSSPVWEEMERQGEFVETPQWEYSDDLAYSATHREVHQRNTGLFSAHRVAWSWKYAQEATETEETEAEDIELDDTETETETELETETEQGTETETEPEP